MTHLFAEPATRFFALYGNTDDFIATPQLRLLDLRQWLAEYCRSLGYQRVVFYSGGKKIHFVDEASARLAQPARKSQTEKAPAGRHGFSVLGKFGAPLGYPRLGMGRRAKVEDIPAASDDVPMAISGDDAQIGRRLDSYMHDGEIPTTLVFQHAEDVIDSIDQDARRSWNEHFHGWQRLPPGNRNICICIFGRQPDIGRFERDVLCDRFIDKDRKWFAYDCFNIGAARQDEVGHLLNALRLKGNLAWMPERIENATRRLAQSLTPDEISEPLLTLTRLHDRILEPGNVPPVSDDPWAELRAMPALDRQVGEKLRKLVEDALKIQQQQREKYPESMPPPACAPLLVERLRPPRKTPGDGPRLHIALLGSPGTGKTTLARLIGRIYKREGLLSSGHFIEAKASDLIAGYIGQTALKTAEIVQRAMGGVLFIDEAYALAKKDGTFADECVAELVAAMTRYGDFAIIIAGYTKEINDFLSSPETNPGLARRFPNRWTLENYTGPELHAIFLNMAAKDGYRLSESLLAALPKAFDAWARGQDAERFGNAGEVRNLWEHVRRQADGRTLIEAGDFIGTPAWESLLGLRKTPSLEEVLRPLDGLVGLEKVRAALESLHDLLWVRWTQEGNLAGTAPGHYLFLGNPGVGKTTVAELMAKMLFDMGLLENGVPVKKSATSFFQSHTRTEEAIRDALRRASGGVLFIDKAHQLAENPEGRNVLNVLIPEMENQRNSLCVILAGYPQRMQRLKAMDPGLGSRIGKEIIFDDLEPAELLEVTENMLRAEDRTLAPDARDRLLRLLAFYYAKRDQEFGNACFLREHLLDGEVIPALAARVRNKKLPEQETREALLTVQLADLPVPEGFQPEDWNDAVSGGAPTNPETALIRRRN